MELYHDSPLKSFADVPATVVAVGYPTCKTAETREMVVAAKINELYRTAENLKVNAVKNAIQCGVLLTNVKKSLPHGQFQEWISTNTLLPYPTAAKYMKAAQIKLSGGDISKISWVYPSGKKTAEPDPEPDSSQVAETTSKSITQIDIKVGIDILKNAPAGEFRRKLVRDYQEGDYEVRRLRKQLERAEIRLRNAEACVMSAVSRYIAENNINSVRM